jgi:hypothetical protein
MAHVILLPFYMASAFSIQPPNVLALSPRIILRLASSLSISPLSVLSNIRTPHISKFDLAANSAIAVAAALFVEVTVRYTDLNSDLLSHLLLGAL